MIDSHCHLNFNELAENFHNIINNSKLNNITSILSINTDPEDRVLFIKSGTLLI